MYPSVDMIEYLAERLQIKYTYNELVSFGILNDEPTDSQPSPVKRQLYGRRASFMTLDNDSDDEGGGGGSSSGPNTPSGNESYNEKVALALSGESIKQGWLKKVIIFLFLYFFVSKCDYICEFQFNYIEKSWWKMAKEMVCFKSSWVVIL